MKRHWSFLLPALMALAMITGCGLHATQRAAVDNFASSTAAVGKIASNEVVSMRNEAISMNRSALELAGPRKDFVEMGKFEGIFTPEVTTAIFRAVEMLKTYGESLQTLVKDTREDDLKKAADNLVKSTDGIPAEYLTLSKDDKDAIAKLVTTGGGMFLEEMKKEYVLKIVRTYKEPVNRLAGTIAHTFDQQADGTPAGIYLLYAARTAATAVRIFDKCIDIYCREKALKAHEDAQGNFTRSKVIFADIRDALIKLQKANNEMALAVESDAVSEKDIKEFGTNVKVLVDAVRVLSK